MTEAPRPKAAVDDAGTPAVTNRALEAWLQCERRAWLRWHRPELASPADGLERYLQLQRTDLRRVYGQRWPQATGPVAIGPGSGSADALAGAPAGGAETLLDVTLETAPASPDGTGLRARVDGVRRIGAGWALEAIAAGTRSRPHHVRRLAFARHVAAALGLVAQRSHVVHVSRGSDPLAPSLVTRDVTDAVIEEQGKLPQRLRSLLASLKAPSEPRTGIGPHCHRPGRCPFVPHCWARYADHSIFHVAGLSTRTRMALRSAGFLDLRSLPKGTPGLSDAERRALDDALEGRIRVDVQALRGGLAQLAFPVGYLDMEFATPAVPWVPGTAPFQPLPFQFSLHVEDRQGGVRQAGYLHRDRDRDPRPGLARALVAATAEVGTLVVYDAAAERLALSELVEAVPDVAAALEHARGRIWDLLALVRTAVRHPRFGTRWGLKRVASTLAPGSYEGVALADGLAAQAAWRELLAHGDAAVGTLLTAYCQADSAALLSIVRVLRRWAEEGAPVRREG